MTNLPLLWSFRRCPYAMRARMGISSSGIKIRLREILLRDKPDEFLAVSSKATVPVLDAGDGTVIEESLDIMLWVLGQADPQKLLAPETGSRQDMLDLIERCEQDFKPHLDIFKYSTRHKGTDPIAARDQALVFLRDLERQLAATNFLFGISLSLPDIAIFPFVRQFAGVDPKWFTSLELPHLQTWLQELVTSPLFTGIMEKHQPWLVSGDEILMNAA